MRLLLLLLQRSLAATLVMPARLAALLLPRRFSQTCKQAVSRRLARGRVAALPGWACCALQRDLSRLVHGLVQVLTDCVLQPCDTRNMLLHNNIVRAV